MMRKGQVRAAVLGAVLAMMASLVQADTLADVLIKTYQQSPLLETARAQLRATDENVAQARAQRRPFIDLNADYTVSRSGVDDNWNTTDQARASLDLTLVLYDHGQSAAAIEASKAQVSAGRADLKTQEQNVLGAAIAAYADVLSNREFVELSRRNVSVLQQQVQAARDRFEVGEVTRTDVSLAQARQAEAEAILARSLGQLEVARETFRAVVGEAPRNLAPLPPLPALPSTLDEAEAIAMRESPTLVATRFSELVAVHDLERARGALGPSLSLGAGVSVTNSDDTIFGGSNTNRGGNVGLRGNLPLYRGGALSSAVRQAEQILASRKYQVQNAARLVRQDVASAWSTLLVARATIAANERQIEAAQVTYDGVVEEAKLGARTTLDVLDREQELRDARFQQVQAKRDEFVAAYNVLAAVGLLTVEHLNLGVTVYDPDIHYGQAERAPYSTRFDGSVVDKIRDRWSQ